MLNTAIQLAELHPLATVFLAVFLPCMAYVAYQTWKTLKTPHKGIKQQELAFWEQFARAQKITRRYR